MAEARAAARLGRNPDFPCNPRWTEQRVHAMRWVIRRKLETLPAWMGAILLRTGDRPIVEISTRDQYWGARPEAPPGGTIYRGRNVLGRLWMELRQHARDDDPLRHSEAWLAKIRIGKLAQTPA